MVIGQATLLALSLAAGTNEIVVNSAADGPVDLTDTVITLRDAIAAANDDVAVSPGGVVASGFDVIVFDDALNGQTITLTDGRLTVNQSLTIHGPGARQLTISGGGVSRIFLFGGNGSNEYELFDLTLAEGFASRNTPGETFNGSGGTIRMINSTDSILLSDILLRDSATTNHSGGAIFVAFGDLTIRNSSIINTGSGQGIVHVQDGIVDVSNSTFSGNAGSFGTIWARESELTLNNATIVNNSAGGVFLSAESKAEFASVTYSNAIIASNSGDQFRENAVGTVSVVSMGNNIVGDDSGDQAPAISDQLNTDPLLMPLTEIAGQFVHPPLPASSAIDGGDSATAEPLDQLGRTRFDGDGNGTAEPDIGAVEFFQNVLFADGFELPIEARLR